ncbi:hypothetical protein KR044_000054, partial [Drosophila immigrans]
MLARKYEVCPRAPPVHERIALQCAKNISKLAAALPKPRTLSGHLPVLVELRAQGEPNTVYRYQVNLPPSSAEKDHPMQSDEAKALSNRLHLPCLVHDHQQSEQHAPPEDPPQLVMVQESVHVVANQGDDRDCPVSTFQNNGYAIGATKTTHDHFMATLHEQQPSPLQFTMLWADHNYDIDEQQQQQLLMMPQPQAELPPKSTADQPQLQPRLLNGYKLTSSPSPPRKPAKQFYPLPKPHNPTRLIYQPQSQPQSVGCSFGFVSPQLLPGNIFQMPQGFNAAIAPHGIYAPTTGRDFNLKFKPNVRNVLALADPQQQQYVGGNQARAIYRPLPRVQEFGQSLELQRELQKRQQLDHTLTKQQKNKRISADSLVTTQMPPELQTLFHWDCCHLCHTAMRTMRNALDHYLSRTHQRRVDSWLIRYSFATGPNLSEDMLRHLRSSGPVVLHCDLCDLKLTSVIHARQHFDGRRHRLVERHITKPFGEGYYDKTGRWVRTNDKWLTCKVCDVIVTSESQLAIHMAGVRHRKRERSPAPPTFSNSYNGNHVYRIHPNGSLSPLNPRGNYIYAKQKLRKFNDPNATYYCEVCNITLNHMKSVKQHENGRTHNRKLEWVPQPEQMFI